MRTATYIFVENRENINNFQVEKKRTLSAAILKKKKNHYENTPIQIY